MDRFAVVEWFCSAYACVLILMGDDVLTAGDLRNFRSLVLSFLGAKVTWNSYSRERKCPGTFAPRHQLSLIRI